MKITDFILYGTDKSGKNLTLFVSKNNYQLSSSSLRISLECGGSVFHAVDEFTWKQFSNLVNQHFDLNQKIMLDSVRSKNKNKFIHTSIKKIQKKLYKYNKEFSFDIKTDKESENRYLTIKKNGGKR